MVKYERGVVGYSGYEEETRDAVLWGFIAYTLYGN